MEYDKQSTTNPGQEPKMSVITVPEQYRVQVLERLAELTADYTDVTGHMMTGGLGVHRSGTRCYLYDSTDGGGLGLDINCPDHD